MDPTLNPEARRENENSRLADLAKPKSASHSRPNTAIGDSYYGLLSQDTTVGPILKEHWTRQGYDLSSKSRFTRDPVSDPASITSNDEVRIDLSRVVSGGHRSSTARRGVGARGVSAMGMAGRAQTSRGRQRPRAGPQPRPGSAVSRRRQRPVTAPHAAQTGFSGSRSGGHQGERAARRGEDGFSCSSSRWQNNSRASTRDESHSMQGSMTISVKEMPSNMGVRAGGSEGFVSEVAKEAVTALEDIDRFDAKREREEERRKNGQSRHENWFSKPHAVSSRKPNPRGAIPGALSEEPNWFTFMAEGKQ